VAEALITTLAARVGVILLDTKFARPPGDIGNPATFAGQALFDIVPGASIARVTAREAALDAAFVAARDRLVARGAVLVTTSCGFLVTMQAALQTGCKVPVVTSALLQLPRVAAGRQVGVMAMDARGLTPQMLEAAGAAAETPVVGLEHGRELHRVLSANDPDLTLDHNAATRDVIEAGRALLARHPDLGAIVFECANLPPYRAALQAALGVEVFDILTLLRDMLHL
jgi:hypothetical protein